MSANNLEQYIKQGETQKEITLDPALWDRLERRLDFEKDIDFTSKRRKRKSHFNLYQLMIAASFVILFAFSGIFFWSSTTYEVSDLDLTSKPYFTKEEIQRVNSHYANAALTIG